MPITKGYKQLGLAERRLWSKLTDRKGHIR